MTKWHLMFVGFLALAAAVLVGLNWTTTVDQTVDVETETDPVKTKTQQAPKKSEGAGSDLQAKLKARCEKLVAERVGEDQEAEIEEACACAIDEIHDEFEEELPDMVTSGKVDPVTSDRMDEIIGECVQSTGIELQ